MDSQPLSESQQFSYLLSFVIAAKHGNLDTIIRLHRQGMDINAEDGMALCSAAGEGRLEVARYLVDHGAEINAQNEAALRAAIDKEHLNVTAYLVECGADTRQIEPSAYRRPSAHHVDVAAFMENAGTLAERAETMQPHERGLWYRSACIAAALSGFDSNDILAREDQVARAAAHVLPLAEKLFDRSMQYNEQNPAMGHPEIPTPEKLLRKIGLEPYNAARGMRDMATEYVESVLLPHVLQNEAARADRDTVIALKDALLPVAAHILFGDKHLSEAVQLSERWHRQGGGIAAELRPLRTGAWYPRIADYITGINDPETGEKLVIRPLTSQAALDLETFHLGHCVGTSDYGTRCQEGREHILSIQTQSGIPLATLAVDVDLKETQFKGKNDGYPPEAAKRAWGEFSGMVKVRGVTLLTPPPGEKWGETKESRASKEHMPYAYQVIGYPPAREQIEACHAHYAAGNLHVKEPHAVKVRDERFGATPRYEHSYRWRKAVSGGTVEEAIRCAGQENAVNAIRREFRLAAASVWKL